MPSTRSSSFSKPLPSSTVITPSLPTLSIASAIVLPIDASALAEIEPTCAISLLVVHGLLIFFSSSTIPITALSNTFTPTIILFRTPSPKRTSFAAMIYFSWCSSSVDAWFDIRRLSADDADDVVFAHMQQFGVVHLEFLAGILAEEDLVAGLDTHRLKLAVVVGLAGAHGHDFAHRGLFRSGVRDDDAAGRFPLFLEALDDHAIVQGTQFHG